jgi:stearoyl-CoA desaturase (delta-9 desaturase)
LVAILAVGEGWHNYHHTFPWDYKTSELGIYRYNLTALFIDFFAWIGWAYDLKTVPEKVVRDRVNRTGDGTHELFEKDQNSNSTSDSTMTIKETHHDYHQPPVWGWGDEDISQEHLLLTESVKAKAA